MRHREGRRRGFGNRDFASVVGGQATGAWLVIAAAFAGNAWQRGTGVAA